MSKLAIIATSLTCQGGDLHGAFCTLAWTLLPIQGSHDKSEVCQIRIISFIRLRNLSDFDPPCQFNNCVPLPLFCPLQRMPTRTYKCLVHSLMPGLLHITFEGCHDFTRLAESSDHSAPAWV
ncbi:unnamed protein product [Protopolystoma xenopodis]|uniref:Uncharacterized protein n=1 Tax=Protopolystoma xenopodis TaxID=117903 RepID=A0A448WAL5_9PLAT|nr:unnamed protein product [Protopolystoma xenopodis]